MLDYSGLIGALTAPDRLGLLDSRAAARYECDARAWECTLHARACSRMIALSGRSHSVTCTECDRRESRMLACHTKTCEVRRGICRRSQRRHVHGHVFQGRYPGPGEMVASAPVGDAEVMPGLGPVPLGRWQSATEER